MIYQSSFNLHSYGPANLFDITEEILSEISRSEVDGGLISIFSIGSTGAILALPEDEGLKEAFESWAMKKIPFDVIHRHPGNAFAHLRSTFLGTNKVFPIKNPSIFGEKKVFLLENTAGRKNRKLVATIMGTKRSGEGSNEMKVKSEKVSVEMNGWVDIADITPQVYEVVRKANFKEGMVLIFAPQEKTALSTLEYETRLILDTADFVSKLVEDVEDEEQKGNIAASVLGTSCCFPISKGALELGTWQQIALFDMGKPGKKEVLIQILGN